MSNITLSGNKIDPTQHWWASKIQFDLKTPVPHIWIEIHALRWRWDRGHTKMYHTMASEECSKQVGGEVGWVSIKHPRPGWCFPSNGYGLDSADRRVAIPYGKLVCFHMRRRESTENWQVFFKTSLASKVQFWRMDVLGPKCQRSG